MDLIKAIEIFATVTGVIYVLLEVGQKNLMWVVGILTAAACSYSFGVQRLWASMGLNIYYVGVSVWGLYQWRRAQSLLSETSQKESEDSSGAIHLRHPSQRTLLVSLLIFILGSVALIGLLRLLGGSESSLDAVVTVASAVGTWWLAKSYPQQWLVWIAADVLYVFLCLKTGLFWMSLMYLCYFLFAVYGYWNWMRKGVWIEE